MEKFCVFCGNKPQNKNKEHIIPQWLIKMTGDKNRIANWGIDYQNIIFDDSKDAVKREYSFLQFTFPACEKCNSEFGDKLEGQAKAVVERILQEEEITEAEMVVLLDWFDKIRIGMWLAYIYYNKEHEIAPKFHISTRIRQTDRALFIYKVDDNCDGLNFYGPGTPLYTNCPVYLGMRIKNYFFVNMATDFLLLKDLGFPYSESVEIDKMGNVGIENFEKGMEYIVDDFYEQINGMKTDKMIFQPIYKKYMGSEEFSSDYVKNNSIQEGEGKVFVVDKGIVRKAEEEKYSMNPGLVYSNTETMHKKIFLKVAKLMIKNAKKNIEMLEKVEDSESLKEELQVGITFEETIIKKLCEG